jgi:hypothetical protein
MKGNGIQGAWQQERLRFPWWMENDGRLFVILHAILKFQISVQNPKSSKSP